MHDALAERPAFMRAAVLQRESLIVRRAKDRDAPAGCSTHARAAAGCLSSAPMSTQSSCHASPFSKRGSSASGVNSCASLPAARSAQGSRCTNAANRRSARTARCRPACPRRPLRIFSSADAIGPFVHALEIAALLAIELHQRDDDFEASSSLSDLAEQFACPGCADPPRPRTRFRSRCRRRSRRRPCRSLPRNCADSPRPRS